MQLIFSPFCKEPTRLYGICVICVIFYLVKLETPTEHCNPILKYFLCASEIHQTQVDSLFEQMPGAEL